MVMVAAWTKVLLFGFIFVHPSLAGLNLVVNGGLLWI
jgi:hypothetical protein